MIWFIGAALVAILALGLGLPMLRGRPDAAAGAGDIATPGLAGPARDVAVYRDQLRGIEADAAAGRLAAPEAAQLRAEIGRRLLDADRALRKAAPAPVAPGAPGRGARSAGLGVLALALAGGFYTYAWLGAPELPDQPRQPRIAAAEAAYAARPSQAEAEAAAPARPAPETPPGFTDLLDELRLRMADQPEARGLRMLADFEARMGRAAAARDAMARLIALEGEAAGPEAHLELAVLMIDAAGGLITPDAEAEIATVLARDAANPQARFLQGLLFIQSGRPDRAFPIWRALLAEGPADAPWLVPVRQGIMDLAWLAGDPNYTPPGAPTEAATAPAMDADAAAAIAAMDADTRAEAIAGMVRALEERLVREGGPAQDWAQLVRALGVQGDTDHARLIRDKARGIFRGDAASLSVIDAAGAEAGLD